MHHNKRLESQENSRWGVGDVSGGGGPVSFPGSAGGMGLCCVRSATPHFFTTPFFDADRRCEIGAVTPTCADRFPCTDFLRRFAPPLAIAGGSCLQGTMSTSFGTTGAKPWSGDCTTTYTSSQQQIAETAHNSVHLPTQLDSANWYRHDTMQPVR